MKTVGLLPTFFLILFSFMANAAVEAQDEPIVIGKRTGFQSVVLNEWRPLEVYLPKSYSELDKSYPVLITLDGGWMFQYAVSLIHMMSPNHFPEMVVIGLPNTDRGRDMNPAANGSSPAEEGTENFMRFFAKDLLPYLEKEYRVLPYRILAGHSLAGFFTLYTFAKEPLLFNAYIATSPSIQNPERMKILRYTIRSHPVERYAERYVYFSAGGEEGEEIHAAVHDFGALLQSLGAPKLEWASDVFDAEGHVPVKGLYKGLRTLFPTWIVSMDIFVHGDMTDLQAHYSSLSHRYGFAVAPPTAILSSVGRRLQREGQVDEAIDVFKGYVSHYPGSAEAYVLLAEAYLRTDRLALAEENVRKALKLDPENEEAKKMLEKLNK